MSPADPVSPRHRRWQRALLGEMGIGTCWRLREAPPEEVGLEDALPRPAVTAVPHALPPREDGAALPAMPRPPRPALVCPMPSPSAAPSRPAPGTDDGAQVGPAADSAREAGIAGLDWAALEARIRACGDCVLCEQRRQAVPGVGDRRARWLFVGKGPGKEEDARGEPFVGPAGRLLDTMLASIGLTRGNDVYIANAVKCRPPFNRTPEPAEIAACRPYLARQIALIAPRLIVALGRPAAAALLGRELTIGEARGKLFRHDGIPVVVTYHPAYLLRNPLDKRKAWEDLCFACDSFAQAAEAAL